MPDDRDALSPATAEDVADALAPALRFQGRKRVHNADEIMSAIVAKRLVEPLGGWGFLGFSEGGAEKLPRDLPLYWGVLARKSDHVSSLPGLGAGYRPSNR